MTLTERSTIARPNKPHNRRNPVAYYHSMRLLATADLHYNHARSKRLAEELIARLNATECDALLVVGDTAIPDGPSLEQCLSLFRFAGPRLFVPGNHELWTHAPDSHAILTEDLPRRVSALGWHYLPGRPFTRGHVSIVGSLGWYDYAFANPALGIPHRFYAQKISPGAAAQLSEFQHLLTEASDVAKTAMDIHARWNDGRFIRLHRSDEAFLDEVLAQLEADLSSVPPGNDVVAAVHHVPFRELLPPQSRPQFEFAKAYLGSPRLGELLLRHPNVRHVLCGHSHFPAEAQVHHLRAINIGSGYRQKTHVMLTL
jgi:hypothetical protein